MLEFIIGRAGTGKTSRCLHDIEERLALHPEGAPLFFILPEHMTFEMERQLAVLMKDKGGFSRAFVFGFRRLCRFILNSSGGAMKPHVTETGKNLLLSRTILACHNKLTVLAKAARQRNFTAFLCAAVEELKTYGISPENLQESIPTFKDEALRQKLTDIALLYGKYNEAAEGRYNDTEDIMAMTAQKILTINSLRGCEIWLDGFTFFNPQEQSVLASLFKMASAVHISLCLDDVKSRKNNEETALFHRQYMTYREIAEMCRQLKIQLKITKLTETCRFLKPAQKAIEQKLFSFPLQKAEGAEGLMIAEAANKRLEAEAVAVDILRLCRDEEYTYDEIGILTRESGYDNLLQAVLKDYDIPYFCESKRLFVHHPLAELLRSCLEAVRTWQYEPLLRCFKTDFFPAARNDIDLLENYLLEFGIRGKKHWLEDEDWHYCRQPLADQVLSVEEEEYLTKINSVRKIVIKPLQKLSEELQQAENARDITQALYQFMMQLNVPEKLSIWQHEAEKSGELVLAKEQQQIWQDTVELLDQIVETCGDEEFSLKEYADVLNDGLESMRIALIPPGIDYVTIAGFDQNNLENKSAVYILGANEGIMPQHSKAEGLLSDADRLYLSQAGIKLSGGTDDENFFENFLLYKAFTLSRKYLWISYPLADADGAALNRSPLIDRLHFILPLQKKQTRFILLENHLEKDEKRRAVTPRRSISYLTTALRQYKERNEIAPFWFDVYNWLLQHDLRQKMFNSLAGLFAKAAEANLSRQSARQLYAKNKILQGSVTRFEQFNSCPFKHFAGYALKLSERAEYNFSAPERGVLLHETMRVFGQILLEQKKRWNDISEQERHALCDKIVRELSQRLRNKILLSSRQYEHLTKRISEVAQQAVDRLSGFAEHSSFSPVALEQAFGRGRTALPPLVYELEHGQKIDISGQIDRIDSESSGRYFLIIDYKSGGAYINIAEVYYGLKLQLLTYILAVSSGPQKLHLSADAVPAGILYCFLKSTLLTFGSQRSEEEIKAAIVKEMRMSGWVLLDADLVKKIDDSSSFIKVKFNKDGAISKISRASIKSEEEFNALLKFMEKQLVNTGNAILGGEIAPYPYKLKGKTACAYCPYIAVCRFDTALPGYEYHELGMENDEALMHQILADASDIEDKT